MFPAVEPPRITEIQVRIDCNGCVQKIKKALHGINGIYDVFFDLPQQKLTIIGWADPEKIIKAIKRTRKTATICSHSEVQGPPPGQPTEPPPFDGGGGPPPPPQDSGGPPPPQNSGGGPPPQNSGGGPPPSEQPQLEPSRDQQHHQQQQHHHHQQEQYHQQQQNQQQQQQQQQQYHHQQQEQQQQPLPPLEPPRDQQPHPPNGEPPHHHPQPKEAEEVHVIHHHPPRYGYGHNQGYGPGYDPRTMGHSQGYGPSYNPGPPEYRPERPHVNHNYHQYTPPAYVTQYEYVPTSSPTYSSPYARMDNSYYYGNNNNNNGYDTSMFNEENPNACIIC